MASHDDGAKTSKKSGNGGKRASLFNKLAKATSTATGKPITFCLALGIIVVWGISGPIFHFSDTWQLVINTGTTIITFLMVFLIQNTQNRDSEAIHLKLDALIMAIEAADDEMIDIEGLDTEELKKIHERYSTMAETACHALKEAKQKQSSDDARSADEKLVADEKADAA